MKIKLTSTLPSAKSMRCLWKLHRVLSIYSNHKSSFISAWWFCLNLCPAYYTTALYYHFILRSFQVFYLQTWRILFLFLSAMVYIDWRWSYIVFKVLSHIKIFVRQLLLLFVGAEKVMCRKKSATFATARLTKQ